MRIGVFHQLQCIWVSRTYSTEVVKALHLIKVLNNFFDAFKSRGTKQRFGGLIYDNKDQMSEVTMLNLLQSIRQIDRQAQFGVFNQQESISSSSQSLEPYWHCLQRSLEQLARARMLVEEYKKLQQALQRQQTQIRKRISIEQQLKLYTDALKVQVEDLEKEKMHLLQNSKAYIKELKASNQQLYADLAHVKRKASKEHTPVRKKDKNTPNKSSSHHKSKHDGSIRQIIKTQHIQRNHSSSHGKRHKKQAYSTISGEMEMQENSKTFHVSTLQSNKKEKEKLNSHPSRKRNKYLFSNYTLLSYLENSNRQKHKEKPATTKFPPKKDNTAKQSSKWKDKNRSNSVPKPSSNPKQTI